MNACAMKELFKRLRKRNLSNDPSIALFPIGLCGKVATLDDAISYRIMRKGADKINFTRKEALSHAGPETSSENGCVLTGHPLEPTEFDHPIRCPHPEPCIIQDGRVLKERAPSLRRMGQLPFLTESELQRLRWNRRSTPSDVQIYPVASAPEHSLISALR